MEGELGLPSRLNQIGIGTIENKTENLSNTDTASRELVPLSPTTLFFTTSSLSLTGDSPRNKFQLYIIGVYAFFVSLFLLGILIIVATKLYKACRTRSHPHDDYDSMSRERLNGLQNPIIVHVNEQPTFIRTCQEHDSDYDYYSDASNGEANDSKDIPPDYEEPPSYSAALHSSIRVC